MDQITMDFIRSETEILAEQYYQQICDVLSGSGLGYDLSKITVESRAPQKESAYSSILFFNKPCFHIKESGKVKRKIHIEMCSQFTKLLEERAYLGGKVQTNKWLKIDAAVFDGFTDLVQQIEELYEGALRDSDTFGCCSRYVVCSDEKRCIVNDIMYSGRCAYRQNLKAGRIFYGKNKNI